MKNSNTTRLLLLSLLLLLNVGCDQISKGIARQKIDLYEQIPVIENHFTLTKVENTGAFLSAGDQWPDELRWLVLSAFPLVVLGIGVYYLITARDLPMLTQIGISTIIGGGIGNIYDRIRYGSVTDFMHLDFGFFSTGIFNFADVSIMVGVGLMLLKTFSGNKEKPQVVDATEEDRH